jgi:amyloid beta precursor protein binding protein 1
MTDEKLYDRQIRLWGVRGQAAIQTTSLYVLGSDCQATEFLKTMLLHGITKVTIVDDAIVTEEDLRTNFFVDSLTDPSGAPLYRANIVSTLLAELNPYAKVTPVVAPPSSHPGLDALESTAVVITVGNLTVEYLTSLSGILYPRGIRQIHFQTTGFFGAFYIDGGLHHAIEGASDIRDPPELRILNPFPELEAFANSLNLESLSDPDHSHIPYVALLILARRAVMADLGVTKLTRDHRNALLNKLKSWRRSRPNDEGVMQLIVEAGFDEAEEKVLSAWGSPYVSTDTTDCFSLLESHVPASNNEPFWQLVRASKNFLDRHGVLPHYGGCPDMESTPALFKRIKDIYKAKSAADTAELLADPAITTPIDPEYAELFVKNVWRIGAVPYERIGYYLELKKELPDDAEWWEPSDRTTFDRLAIVRYLFIAARHFLAKTGRIAGTESGDEADILQEVVALGGNPEIAPAFVKEFVKYKGSVLPSVVGSLAAILAAEATKLIIQQAGPTKGIVIYDALHGLTDQIIG